MWFAALSSWCLIFFQYRRVWSLTVNACVSFEDTRAHTHANMPNTKSMISTKNLGTHPNIGHQSKTDWQRAILIRSNARSPQGEPLPNPIHYCPLYPFHLLGFSTSLSLSLPLLPLYTAYMWTRVLSVYMIWERETLPGGGQLSASRVCAL